MKFSLTPAAEKFIGRLIRFNGREDSGFRLAVTAGGCSGLSARFEVAAAPHPGDTVVQHGDIRLFLPAESRLLLDGITIDFAERPTESGLIFS